MAKYKKISEKQFVKDVIDFELKKYGIGYDYVTSLPKRPLNDDEADPNTEYQDDWFRRYAFDSFEEFNAWREYFYERYKDWQPQRNWRKILVDREFEWFNLMWGLATNYDFDEHMNSKAKDDMFARVFRKKKNKKKEKDND